MDMSVRKLTFAESHAVRMQSALRDMLRKQPHSHWVTLNFHDNYEQDAAVRKLRYWSCDIHSRLFSQRLFQGVNTDQIFRFFAFPEFTLQGHPHFHLCIWLDQRRVDYFERIAADMWQKQVPTGSFDIQKIVQTDTDYSRVIAYGTKKSMLAWHNSNFIHSSMLNLPSICF